MHCLVPGSESLVISLHQEAGICPLSALFGCLKRIKSRQVYLNIISFLFKQGYYFGTSVEFPNCLDSLKLIND